MGATSGIVVFALASGCDSEPAPNDDAEGGAAGMSGAGGTASPAIGGKSSTEGGASVSGGPGDEGEGGAQHVAGQGGAGGEPGTAGAGGEPGMAGAGGDAGACVKPLASVEPADFPYGTQLPSLNDSCYQAGGFYTAHYFELAAPSWVTFGLRRSTVGENRYAALTSGCTGTGPIIDALGYCHSNAIELPAGTYSFGGCGLDGDPMNRSIRVVDAPLAPTNIDCDSAAPLPASTQGLVIDSTPRYYAFEHWNERDWWFGLEGNVGGTVHAELVNGCDVDAVTYASLDFPVCYGGSYILKGLPLGMYYLKVSGWEPGAQWTLSADYY